MGSERAGQMNARALREVAGQGRALTGEERQWCTGELTGVLADHNPLPDPEKAADSVLAACLLRAWETSIRCDCE